MFSQSDHQHLLEREDREDFNALDLETEKNLLHDIL
jgi:hypothetical protein